MHLLNEEHTHNNSGAYEEDNELKITSQFSNKKLKILILKIESLDLFVLASESNLSSDDVVDVHFYHYYDYRNHNLFVVLSQS